MMRKVLCLDLGTQTGWCLRHGDGRVRSGVQNFSAPKHQAVGWRYAKFQRFLEGARQAAGGLDWLLYENVAFLAERTNPKTGQVFRTGFQAVQLWGGFEALTTAWCEYHGIKYQGVHVMTLKKSLTGSGRAKKPEMVAAVRQLGHDPKDDNEADALALYYHFRRVIEPSVDL